MDIRKEIETLSLEWISEVKKKKPTAKGKWDWLIRIVNLCYKKDLKMDDERYENNGTNKKMFYIILEISFYNILLTNIHNKRHFQVFMLTGYHLQYK